MSDWKTGWPADMLGQLFTVRWAHEVFGPDAKGVIVTQCATGRWVWTGGIISPQEAASRLLLKRA